MRTRNLEEQIDHQLDLTGVLLEGANKIPTIWIPDAIFRLTSKAKQDLTQKELPLRKVNSHSSRIPAWLTISFFSSLLQICLYRGLGSTRANGPWSADFWNLVFGGLVFLGLVFPRITWYRLIDFAPRIEVLLGSKQNIEVIKNWLIKALRPYLQMALVLGGGCLATICLLIIHRPIARNVRVDAISYLTIFLVGAVVASGFYWVLALTMLVRKIIRRHGLSLSWFDPSLSPGVSELSRLLGMVFAISMLGVAIISWSMLSASSGLTNGGARTLMYFLLVLGPTALIFVGVAPQFWLMSAVQERRRSVLSEIGLNAGDQPGTGSESGFENTLYKLKLYREIREISTPSMNPGAIIGYAASALAGFTPLIVQVLNHH